MAKPKAKPQSARKYGSASEPCPIAGDKPDLVVMVGSAAGPLDGFVVSVRDVVKKESRQTTSGGGLAAFRGLHPGPATLQVELDARQAEQFKPQSMQMNIELGNTVRQLLKLVSKRAMLKAGSKGPAVRDLQQRLVKLGHAVGKTGADGDFGPGTRDAVIAFQKKNGLTADGAVGPTTWAALDGQEPHPDEKEMPLRNAKWGADGYAQGEKIQISVEAVGVEDGKVVQFEIEQAQDGVNWQPLQKAEAKVSGGKALAEVVLLKAMPSFAACSFRFHAFLA